MKNEDMSDINKKSTPDQMRVLLKRMRTGNDNWQSESVTQPKKNLDVRDMLKITRRIHEEGEKKTVNMKTIFDQKEEEEKFINYFKDIEANIKFKPLEVYDDFVIWGGVVDGIIEFVYVVTPDESTSDVTFNYLNDFSPDNPENDLIVNRIKDYYNTFYKYWQNNVVQK
jgi:hypothetical protein